MVLCIFCSTMCDPKTSGASSSYDNDGCYVSWRGDGQYFICSTIHPDSGRHLTR